MKAGVGKSASKVYLITEIYLKKTSIACRFIRDPEALDQEYDTSMVFGQAPIIIYMEPGHCY